MKESWIYRSASRHSGFLCTLIYSQLDTLDIVRKIPKNWKKIDTVDLSELEINECKFVKIGDEEIAVCREEGKVTVYVEVCCLAEIGLGILHRGPKLPPAKSL